MKKITEITKEQADRMPEWVAKWIDIGLSTAPADFEAATDAAMRAYRLCNLERPMIVLRLSSPIGATIGGCMALSMLRHTAQVRSQVWSQVWSQVRSQVRPKVWSQVESQVRSQVGSQVGSQVWSQVRSQVESQVGSKVWSQVESQVESQVWSQVRSQVWSQVESQVGSHVESQVWSQVRSQVWSQVRSQALSGIDNDFGGSLWSGWCAYISYIRDVLGLNEESLVDRFDIDETLAKSAGWVWWHENVLAISDRPSELHRDNLGRLHNDNGPSISYRDGWSLWHWHGIAVPKEVILSPHEITVAKIRSQRE